MSRSSIALLLLAAWTGAAHAQDPHPHAPERPQANFEFSGGGHLLVSPNHSCRRDGDVVDCTAPRLGAGFDVATQLRVLPWLALGLHGAGSKLASNGFTLEQSEWLWRLALQARFEPPGWPRGLWLAFEAGAAFLVETYDGLISGVTPIHSSNTQRAPLLAAGAGWDWRWGSAPGFLLGVEVRALWTLFGSRPYLIAPEITGDSLGSLVWISTGARLGIVF